MKIYKSATFKISIMWFIVQCLSAIENLKPYLVLNKQKPILWLIESITSIFTHLNYNHLMTNLIIFILVMLIAHVTNVDNSFIIVTFIVSGAIANFSGLMLAIYKYPHINQILGASGALCGILGVLLTNNLLRALKDNKEPTDSINKNLMIMGGTPFLLFLMNLNVAYISSFMHMIGSIIGIILGIYYYKKHNKKDLL